MEAARNRVDLAQKGIIINRRDECSCGPHRAALYDTLHDELNRIERSLYFI